MKEVKQPTGNFVSPRQVSHLVQAYLSGLPVDNKRVLVLIPDSTRTMPLPMMFDVLRTELLKRTRQLDFLVALGTHPPMTDAELSRLIGAQVRDGQAGKVRVFNHQWNESSALRLVGVLHGPKIAAISQGMLNEDVPVRINAKIQEYDQLIICGPVFPHEVVGFSGGNKYLIPGIAGAEIIDFTHWLGALFTSYRIIGTQDTPVRSIIDLAAGLVEIPVACINLVCSHQGIFGAYLGDPVTSWKAAADCSALKHVIYVEQAYRKVISVMPAMYDDLWTAAKGMYKMEPVVEDGGEVIIYAPHIQEVSRTHGKILEEIGYHCRDFYLKQWSKYQGIPRGILAHSTHLFGQGSFDEKTQKESGRIRVTLATGIPRERCLKLGLGYTDPRNLDVTANAQREAQGILVVPRAGEYLYRLKGTREV